MTGETKRRLTAEAAELPGRIKSAEIASDAETAEALRARLAVVEAELERLAAYAEGRRKGRQA